MSLTSLWVFWKQHQHRIGYLVVGILLFAAGWQVGRVTSPYYAAHPIVFQEAATVSNNGSPEALVALKEAGETKNDAGQVAAAITVSPMPSVGEGSSLSPPASPAGEPQTNSQKIFVGSKNSNLYHHYSCPSAKHIKEANQIWWPTKEAAEAAGYKPSKCTIELNNTN